MLDLRAPVVLLHGLGERPWQLLLLHWFLLAKGFQTVIRPKYRVNDVCADEALDLLDQQLQTLVDKTKPIYVVGQSMGGVMAHRLHEKGWHIVKSISIGSPLHGAKILNILEARLPAWLANNLHRKAYDTLKMPKRLTPPPHPYHTFSMSLPFLKNFDGCVFRRETVFDESNHTHLSFHTHQFVVTNPRLWWNIWQQLQNV